MVPAGPPTDSTIAALAERFESGDVIVDGGNSNYKEAGPTAERLADEGHRVRRRRHLGRRLGADRGLLPHGRRHQGVGRPWSSRPSRRSPPRAATPTSVRSGAGHFVKMVHNGIEYGLMQAYAEGFEIMGAAERVRPRPPRDRRHLALRLGGAELAARADRAGAAARVGLRGHQGVGDRLGRGPLDGRGGDRPGRAGPGHLGRPLRPLRLPPAGLLRQQAAGRAAQPVRRPRGRPSSPAQTGLETLTPES